MYVCYLFRFIAHFLQTRPSANEGLKASVTEFFVSQYKNGFRVESNNWQNKMASDVTTLWPVS